MVGGRWRLALGSVRHRLGEPARPGKAFLALVTQRSARWRERKRAEERVSVLPKVWQCAVRLSASPATDRTHNTHPLTQVATDCASLRMIAPANCENGAHCVHVLARVRAG